MAKKVQTTKEFTSFYTNNREIQAVFYSLVVRRAALDAKYTGGSAKYLRDETCKYNDDICVSSYMAYGYAGAIIEKLSQCGLVPDEDYYYDHFGVMAPGPWQVNSCKLQCSWLRAYMGLTRKTMVYYVELERQTDTPKGDL